MSVSNLITSKITRQNHGAETNCWTRLDRFLASGNESGVYSLREQHTRPEELASVRECLGTDGPLTVRTIMANMLQGIAIGRRHALQALALAASPAFADAQTNTEALQALPQAARTCEELRAFASAAASTRGWGRALRNAIANWYRSKPVADMAREILLDQSNEAWSHRDLIRMSHPKADGDTQQALFRWVVSGELDPVLAFAAVSGDLRLIKAHNKLRRAASEEDVAHLIETYSLPEALISAEWKRSERVWEALLDTMTYLQLVRNLGAMTAAGILCREGEATALVVSRLTDERRIARSNAHPLDLLVALASYRSGEDWQPSSAIESALEVAFALSLASLQTTGKKIYAAVDSSSMMLKAECLGVPGISAADGAWALAMVLNRFDPNLTLAAFNDSIQDVEWSVASGTNRSYAPVQHGGPHSDGSLAIRDALRRGLIVDAFVIITSDGSWDEDTHPAAALQEYRRETGITASLSVAMMSQSRFSIADLRDHKQVASEGLAPSVVELLISAAA